jgi:hypothetical protein
MLNPQPLRSRNTKMSYETNSFKERLTDTFGFTIEDSEELAEPSCPIATQDIKTNLANRQTAVDDANYGPANPNEPNEDYWKAKADEFQGDVVTAKKMLCGNCAAFDQRSKVLGCIKKGIGEDANEVAIGGDLGYCEIFDFKCAAKRTCDAWIVGGPITDKKEELAQPVSQTPAPPKERIKGSKENPEGTASTRSKAGDIEISAENEEALKNKISEFKDKHPSRKAPTIGALKKVFRRGAGAFSTSFRPTITGGKPNSRNAWAMARVNKFLKMASGGEVKDSYRKADGDLLEERFDCGTGAGGFKEGNTCAGGGEGESIKSPTTPKGEGKELWQMTKKEFFHPQISRKFIDAENEKDGTIIGNVGDLIHGEKTRELLKPVLDVPVMVMRTPVVKGERIKTGEDFVFDGASGTFQGKPAIFINPNTKMVGTLYEESAHQMRRATGREIKKADIKKIISGDGDFNKMYKDDPEEISAKRMASYIGTLATKEKSHKQIVEDAFRQGKKVPKEVLKEYGLAK